MKTYFKGVSCSEIFYLVCEDRLLEKIHVAEKYNIEEVTHRSRKISWRSRSSVSQYEDSWGRVE